MRVGRCSSWCTRQCTPVHHTPTTEQRSTVDDLSMTTPAEITSVPTGSDMTSSAGFYFQCAVVFIGIVGTAANALILYAMVVSKQHKKHVLVFNQNALDLYSCVFLVITYVVKLCNIHLSGSLGYWLCIILLTENLLYLGIVGSIINLAIVTVERYLKVVHAVWSKKKLRHWIIYSAAAFSWLSAVIYITAVNFRTLADIDGVCYETIIWKSHVGLIHEIWQSVLVYVVMLLLFIFCYGRILMTVRRQAGLLARYSSARGRSTSQTQSNKIQSSIVKTTVIVSSLFAITWMPYNILYVLMKLDSNLPLLEDAYCAVLFISFLYICANPFIYATKFDPVRRVLLSLIPCKKTDEEENKNVENIRTRSAATRMN